MSESITDRIDATCNKIAMRRFAEFKNKITQQIESFGLEGLYTTGLSYSLGACMQDIIKKFEGVIIDSLSEQENEKIIKQMQNLEAYFRREE